MINCEKEKTPIRDFKKLIFCHKLKLSNPYIFATQYRRFFIFQTKNSVRLYNLSLKYLRFKPSGCKGRYYKIEVCWKKISSFARYILLM